MARVAVCLMGPTAAGKTDIAVGLCKRFPFDVISVDSALVYRGMDIGTAKPDPATLARVPHRLVDIRDPEQAYSAGDFVRDAIAEIEDITAARRIPLLVGGTMLYFRALIDGLSELPSADPTLRQRLDAEAARRGWPALHARLAEVDAAAARRINPHDRQRIQRALEVYLASGKPLSNWHAATRRRDSGAAIDFVAVGLVPSDRKSLHARIEKRLNSMIEKGFLDEVRQLRQRPGLTPEQSSMRAVGYRQLWAHLAGQCSLEEAKRNALVATRQLAKRQLTWLRGNSRLHQIDALAERAPDAIARHLAPKILG